MSVLHHMKLQSIAQNVQDGRTDMEREILIVDYLEEPVICLAPVIPWVRQRSVNRDLVTDILVERVVLTKKMFEGQGTPSPIIPYLIHFLCVTQSTRTNHGFPF